MACSYNHCFIFFLSYALSFLRVVYGAPQVPCFFSFGDSLADTGNNNDLETSAKANFPPYGVDFPGGPTGRFTNGRNFADIIGELLGFTDYPPPYVTSEGKNVLMGVNYASGGSGILPETGKNLGEVFSFDAQLSNHNVTISRINQALQKNDQNNTEFFNKCLYLVGFGSNDYINNYLMPQVSSSSRLYKPDQFAQILIGRYYTQLKNLYNYGARKIALFGLGTIGCSPAIVSTAPTKSASGCMDMATEAVEEFNGRLKPLVDNLNKELMDAHFVYVNSSHIAMTNPGFDGTTPPVPCCKINSNGMCVANQEPCADRGKQAFFDAFHPTEKVVARIAIRAYKSTSPLDVYPMDILHLTQLPT